MPRRIAICAITLLVQLAFQACSEILTTPNLKTPSEADKTLIIADRFDAQPMMDEFPTQFSTDSTPSSTSTPVTYNSSLLVDGSAVVCRDHFKPIDLWWNSPSNLIAFHLNPPLLLVSKGPGVYVDRKGQKFANAVYETLATAYAIDATGQEWAFRGRFSAYCKNGNLVMGPYTLGGQLLVALSPITPPTRSGGGDGDGGSCETQIIYDPAAPCPGGGGGGTGGGTGGGGEGGGTGGCTTEYVILEVSYDDGNTWQVWWEGLARVCS